MPTMTSSFRIDLELNERLNTTARLLKKNKNWIINRAIADYLERAGAFREECRRQSILASKHVTEDERAWMDNWDVEGWK
jgi:predicted transcriptional regulator